MMMMMMMIIIIIIIIITISIMIIIIIIIIIIINIISYSKSHHSSYSQVEPLFYEDEKQRIGQYLQLLYSWRLSPTSRPFIG